MEFDTNEMYQKLFNVSYEGLKQNCMIACGLTGMMQKRADLLRSQLSFPVEATGRNKTFINDFRKVYDEVQAMCKSVQRFVSEWQELCMADNLLVSAATSVEPPLAPESISPCGDLIFDYQKSPLDYENGQAVLLLVISIPKSTHDLFYALDVGKPNVKVLNKIQTAVKTPLAVLPPAGKVFAIKEEGVWLRAVRNRPGCNGDGSKNAIILLDCGQVRSYQPTDCIAEIPYELQTLPACLIKCQLVSGGSKAAFESLDKIFFKVVGVDDGDVLKVEQLPENLLNGVQERNTELNAEPVGKPIEEHISPNDNEVQTQDSDGQRLPATNAEQLNGHAGNSNAITRDTLSKDQLEQRPPAKNKPTNAEQPTGLANGGNNYAITRDTLSKEQLEQLDELPESTTNAMKAILGYVPNDDTQICKFYDPKTKGCFKGGNCRLRHIEKDPDGWTRDRDTVLVCPQLQTMEVPASNTFVTIIPTMVVDMDLFYVHLATPAGLGEAFSQLSEDMNNPDTVANYKKLKLLPAVGELVLAKYEDRWYRGQVCELFDQHLNVFYVDYGNQESLPIDEIRVCDDRFKYMPPQAIACRVANATHTKTFHSEAIEQFWAAVLDKPLKAFIIDNKVPWEVQIFDEEGFDIGHAMVMTNLAKPRNALKIVDEAKIPG